jgi:hypothetical protein
MVTRRLRGRQYPKAVIEQVRASPRWSRHFASCHRVPTDKPLWVSPTLNGLSQHRRFDGGDVGQGCTRKSLRHVRKNLRCVPRRAGHDNHIRCVTWLEPSPRATINGHSKIVTVDIVK